MIGLLQRVHNTSVSIANKEVAAINQGLLVFVGIERGDTQTQADRLLTRLLAYRVFADNDDKMNLSLQDINGGLLLVPQFTLAADTHKGMRPSFSSAASPQQGQNLFEYFCSQAKQQHNIVETGQFGADMQVTLTNDGPVTFWLQIPPPVL
ncbi:MAG: D-tyrosyl-tRNA(Tyr) deacylase [Gammaproteobacteria bacterium]|nr:MAG: D-tyrosyl-tRNA(Tyr) deacylase [Gammaproteobacteria bacterium]RKZ93897.1 MAG: D-tyrosyl-tRNA(Tyr) deacylase [Gammaproteobacteria bacterium]RKZ95319.1 MAG: D-tyrosyl-tRNA(Tyr) deacylase [Gammaproteobacteria bacterium]RLA02426.1 MAG: D-tyrosyl-tRNA(Tyr) deacylase [Gammaproteobacteria bacterium]